MLGHLLYEKIANPQSARDNLQTTLPNLFGGSSKFSLAQYVKDPNTDFFPNSKFGTLDTALSYYLQPKNQQFDEMEIHLANFANDSGWIADVGLHLSPNDLQSPYEDWGVDMHWGGKKNSRTSNLFVINWMYHTSRLAIDLDKGTVNISGSYSDDPHITVAMKDLAASAEEIQAAQGITNRVLMTGLEITEERDVVLGIQFVQRTTQKPFFNLVIPLSLTIDPKRLSQLIPEPQRIKR